MMKHGQSPYDELAQLAIEDVLDRVDTTSETVPHDFCVCVAPPVYDAWLKRPAVRRIDVSHFSHGEPRYALGNGIVAFELDQSLDATDGYVVERTS